jgi:hypothetical protein
LARHCLSSLRFWLNGMVISTPWTLPTRILSTAVFPASVFNINQSLHGTGKVRLTQALRPMARTREKGNKTFGFFYNDVFIL